MGSHQNTEMRRVLASHQTIVYNNAYFVPVTPKWVPFARRGERPQCTFKEDSVTWKHAGSCVVTPLARAKLRGRPLPGKWYADARELIAIKMRTVVSVVEFSVKPRDTVELHGHVLVGPGDTRHAVCVHALDTSDGFRRRTTMERRSLVTSLEERDGALYVNDLRHKLKRTDRPTVTPNVLYYSLGLYNVLTSSDDGEDAAMASALCVTPDLSGTPSGRDAQQGYEKQWRTLSRLLEPMHFVNGRVALADVFSSFASGLPEVGPLGDSATEHGDVYVGLVGMLKAVGASPAAAPHIRALLVELCVLPSIPCMQAKLKVVLDLLTNEKHELVAFLAQVPRSQLGQYALELQDAVPCFAFVRTRHGERRCFRQRMNNQNFCQAHHTGLLRRAAKQINQ